MFLVDWAVKMRIRPPEFETSICDAKYHVSLMLAGFTTEEAEADTVADRGLKRVIQSMKSAGRNKTKKKLFTGALARAVISNDDVTMSTGESSMMTSACLLEVVRAALMTSALLFERNKKSAGAQELESATLTSAYLLDEAGISNADLESATLTSAYLLDEAGISNADVSISVEKRRGIRSLLKLLSTDTVRRVTVDKAVGRYYYRSCWQTSPFKREGIFSHTVAAGVHLWSLGVLTAAGCGIGSVHEVVRSNLLVDPSEVEEGEM
ncbi:ATP binding protein isoform 1 [Dorcoceras hygrometricum]|uniref:ATP binding protein isoform 1 n=1 Tax=Dorcoceras hygrometricum TaxID=472368 RepID=A0A2Z7A769_9LAMI|nr:ATP binding protein isoform 1 [Dorcoceras hygrometricum]